MDHLAGRVRSILVAFPSATSLIDAPDARLGGSPRPDEAPLASLNASSLNARYHAWLGQSGTRYTTSVFPVDRAADGAGLPRFSGFVLVPAVRRGGALRPIDVVPVETDIDRFDAIAAGLAEAATEWHVHLLAKGAPHRRAIVDDLLARHRPRMAAALSA